MATSVGQSGRGRAGNACRDRRLALLFGRITYDMMAAFWPAAWENSTLITGDLVSEVTRLKQEDGPDLVILGSGSLVSQLTEARLIDAYQVVVNPVVLGRGRTLFETVHARLPLRLIRTKAFGNALSASLLRYSDVTTCRRWGPQCSCERSW